MPPNNPAAHPRPGYDARTDLAMTPRTHRGPGTLRVPVISGVLVSVLMAAGLAGHGAKDLWQHRTGYVANTCWVASVLRHGRLACRHDHGRGDFSWRQLLTDRRGRASRSSHVHGRGADADVVVHRDPPVPHVGVHRAGHVAHHAAVVLGP